MTREQKELLFKDLCSRMTYNTKIQLTEYSVTGKKLPSEIKILDYCMLGKVQAYCKGFRKGEVKPYLFPLSSMTEEQREKLHELWDSNMSATLDCGAIYGDELKSGLHQLTAAKKVNEWCYENHLDINNLITNRLAIDATGLNIY